MATLTELRHGLDRGIDRAAPVEAQLAHAYHRELNRIVAIASRGFAHRVIHASATPQTPTRGVPTHLVITAASDVPEPHANAKQWRLPDADEVLSTKAVRAQLLAATTPARTRIVTRVMGGSLAAVGVSFDVTNPLAQHVLATLGTRITEITDLTRREIMHSLADSHEKGLSIQNAARAMQRDVRATNANRARLIARTEFIGAQNGSALAAVRITGAASYKTWVATNDQRTREDHAEASGQTVPLSSSFTVGGSQMMFPGDQNAPADEVCNCRCTLTYGDSPDGR